MEVLLAIREEMAREADFDTDLYTEMVRNGRWSDTEVSHSLVDAAGATAGNPEGSKNAGRRKSRK